MINLYAALQLSSDASEETIRLACRELSDREPQIAREAASVLLDQEKRRLYDLVHQQFVAMSVVQSRAADASQPFIDSNHWDRRFVEFPA